MNKCANADEALTVLRQHGVMLVSAKGDAPRLTEAIVGGPIKGSWWAHARSQQIFVTLSALADSDQVLICRLIGDKLTMVHRRLWPSLVRAAEHFTPRQLARVHEEHTASGKHRTVDIPFPTWVPSEVAQQAELLTEQEALAPFARWRRPPR